MDVKAWIRKITKPVDKYKYVILILIIGVALMMFPTGSTSNKVIAEELQQEAAIPMNEKIAELLSKVEGAGKVEVLLSIKTGEEILYQSDNDVSTNENSSTSRMDTVITSDSQRNEAGLIKQTNPPIYLGAIILCQGADSPTVQLALCDAVCKITGLSSDKISILKMK